MSQAIPFITYSNNMFEIHPSAIDFLNSLKQQKVSIVSVIGKYRSGKSFLINQALIKSPQVNNLIKGFQVGSTINACTKGIWIWPELISHPENLD